VKNFMASSLVSLGTMKLLRILSTTSVSKMKPRGIHERNAVRVLRHCLMSEGLIF